jgi:hypothetical protein
MENHVDAYGRPVPDRKERQVLQAIENKGAMADYKREEQHKRDNRAKLRTERLERESAVITPVSDSASEGAVKKPKELKAVRKEKKAD